MGVISRAAVHQRRPGRLPTPAAGAAGVLGDPGSHQFWGRDDAQGEEGSGKPQERRETQLLWTPLEALRCIHGGTTAWLGSQSTTDMSH